MLLPLQDHPSPEYPGLHEQLYEPSVLLHTASALQLCSSVPHSSISKYACLYLVCYIVNSIFLLNIALILNYRIQQFITTNSASSIWLHYLSRFSLPKKQYQQCSRALLNYFYHLWYLGTHIVGSFIVSIASVLVDSVLIMRNLKIYLALN